VGGLGVTHHLEHQLDGGRAVFRAEIGISAHLGRNGFNEGRLEAGAAGVRLPEY
jgi:hypothetical protein